MTLSVDEKRTVHLTCSWRLQECWHRCDGSHHSQRHTRQCPRIQKCHRSIWGRWLFGVMVQSGKYQNSYTFQPPSLLARAFEGAWQICAGTWFCFELVKYFKSTVYNRQYKHLNLGHYLDHGKQTNIRFLGVRITKCDSTSWDVLQSYRWYRYATHCVGANKWKLTSETGRWWTLINVFTFSRLLQNIGFHAINNMKIVVIIL